MNKIDTNSAEMWASKYAICVDGMDLHGQIINDMKQRPEESLEGQYTCNAGIVAFVVGGKHYATPLVGEACSELKGDGFVETRNVGVPFANFGSFPGVRIYKREVEECIVNWDTGDVVSNPAKKTVDYYIYIKDQYTPYSEWVRLLKLAGKYFPEEDPIIQNITHVWKNQEVYNKAVREDAVALVSAKKAVAAGRKICR